jgi:8-oxo-dGTP diphosphatase
MYTYEYPHPAVTTDAVLFAVRDGAMHVLLIQRAQEPHRGAWALPGGFVDIDESLDEAVQRELREETGIEGVELEQFYTFGDPNRDPRERVITVAYLALVDAERLRPSAADDAMDVGWFPLGALPPLAFDHARVIAMAHDCLRVNLPK